MVFIIKFNCACVGVSKLRALIKFCMTTYCIAKLRRHFWILMFIGPCIIAIVDE